MRSHAELKRQLEDQAWRLNNLYWIINKDNKKIRFQMNWAQQELFEDLWFNNLVLKARQIGMSTFINLLQLDTCVFNDNVKCGVIAHDLDSTEALFRNNIKFPYDNLPESLRQAREVEISQAKYLQFSNNSSIRVATSMRGGTLQILHVSEFGKICAKYPERAREVVTGSLESVGSGNLVFIESTAEGREGYFYDYAQTAQSLQASGKALSREDYRFFFMPWWKHPDYRTTEVRGVVITDERRKYFEELEAKIGQPIPLSRRAWYVRRAERLGDDMFREHPSTPEEAFSQSTMGAYFHAVMMEARKAGRIGKVPHQPAARVETWWDLGWNDDTVIWFVQQVGTQLYVIDYYANSGESLAHYAQVLRDKGYLYSRHIGPHDIKVTDLSTGLTRWEQAQKLGIEFEIVPALSVLDGIEAVRGQLPNCWFDEEKTDPGIKALEQYRKEWDERLGSFKKSPLHNWASHPSDAFRTGIVGRAAQKTVGGVEAPTPGARGWT